MLGLLHVDLTNKSAAREALDAEYQDLGGHALTSAIVARDVDPTTDPLGPGNVLVLAPGILGGTIVANSGRLSVGGKSPLTGGIKEANSGGIAARKIARLGLKAIKVSGKADVLSLLEVTADGGRLMPAPELAGLTSSQTVQALRERYGDRVGIVCIGPAGELGCRASAVVVTTQDFRLRTAARGGLGAVMGSKNLKAIVLDDKGGPGVAVADPAALKAASKAFTDGVLGYPVTGGLTALGTAVLVGVSNMMGSLPTRNFSAGQCAHVDKISGEHILDLMNARPNSSTKHNCMPGCIVSCSQVYTDEEGNEITSGFEYETIGLLGANCLIEDIDTIARIDRLCDELGVDTMDVADACGVAMEAGLLPWGDGDAVLDMLGKLSSGDANARMLCDGCAVTGETLGVTRVPAAKRQGMSAWEPRALKGTGSTYATSPMGADHTQGNLLPSPISDYDPGNPEGQAALSQAAQAGSVAYDSLGLCTFVYLGIQDDPSPDGLARKQALLKCVAAVTGKNIPEDYMETFGARILKIERDFNRRAGFTSADDRLPAFMTTEAIAPHGNVFDVTDADLDAAVAAADAADLDSAVAG